MPGLTQWYVVYVVCLSVFVCFGNHTYTHTHTHTHSLSVLCLLQANLNVFSPCVQLADVRGDQEHRLVVADSDHLLKVFKVQCV
jgi:hypothetical protein